MKWRKSRVFYLLTIYFSLKGPRTIQQISPNRILSRNSPGWKNQIHGRMVAWSPSFVDRTTTHKTKNHRNRQECWILHSNEEWVWAIFFHTSRPRCAYSCLLCGFGRCRPRAFGCRAYSKDEKHAHHFGTSFFFLFVVILIRIPLFYVLIFCFWGQNIHQNFMDFDPSTGIATKFKGKTIHTFSKNEVIIADQNIPFVEELRKRTNVILLGKKKKNICKILNIPKMN